MKGKKKGTAPKNKAGYEDNIPKEEKGAKMRRSKKSRERREGWEKERGIEFRQTEAGCKKRGRNPLGVSWYKGGTSGGRRQCISVSQKSRGVGRK